MLGRCKKEAGLAAAAVSDLGVQGAALLELRRGPRTTPLPAPNLRNDPRLLDIGKIDRDHWPPSHLRLLCMAVALPSYSSTTSSSRGKARPGTCPCPASVAPVTTRVDTLRRVLR